MKQKPYQNTITVHQAVGKVVLRNTVLRNGKNYFWIRITRNKIDNLAKYWRKNPRFYYMKIYVFNRRTRVVGEQIGFITERVATLQIDSKLLWRRQFNPMIKKWEYM